MGRTTSSRIFSGYYSDYSCTKYSSDSAVRFTKNDQAWSTALRFVCMIWVSSNFQLHIQSCAFAGFLISGIGDLFAVAKGGRFP